MKRAKGDDRKRRGAAAEKLARKMLKKAGFRHLMSNYRVAGGEIDIVMQDGETVVFVEVRSKTAGGLARPETTVNYRKQKHLTTAARAFLRQYHLTERPCRFDVVAVTYLDDGGHEIKHFRNAFGPK